MLEPRDERLSCEYAPELGPVGSLSPVPPLPYVGRGKNVGVEGREDGVGMELVVLVVAFVLTLLRPSVETERRDCGRRVPEGIMLCDKLDVLGRDDVDS